MGKTLVNPVVYASWLVLAVGALLYYSGLLRVTIWAGERWGNEAFQALTLPVSILVMFATWPVVLLVVWRSRLAYLRRVAKPVRATVTRREHTATRTSNRILATHEVRLEVLFTHPQKGVEYRVAKRFAFNQLLRSRADDLHEQFPEGATMPVLVRGRSTAYDIPRRPGWIDLW